MAIGNIPWDKTRDYACHYGFDRDDTESLIDLIERLDNEDLKIQAEKAKSGKNSPSKRRN